MSLFDIALMIAVLAGVTAGTVLVVRSPSFWGSMVKAAVLAMLPIILKRMPAEDEQAWRDCQRRNGRWNHQKRRCE